MNTRFITAAACMSVAAVSFLIQCHTTPTHPSSEMDTAAPISVYDLKTGPLTVFDNHCSRCHGTNGSLYGASFYALDQHDMEYDVYDMMTGPAQLKPSTAEVEAMNQYHFAIQQKTPFACITNADSFLTNNTTILVGETTPNTTIKLMKDNTETNSVISKYKWTVQNPPQMPFTVHISNSDHTLTFDFPAQQWTSLPQENEGIKTP